MQYRRISADCHLDMIWLPPDLFTSQAPRHLKDRMPFVAEGKNGEEMVANNGASFGLVGGVGSAGRLYEPGKQHHFEELIHSHPSLGLAMTRLMIVRRRELENKVEALVFRDVSSKLAELLVKLAGEYGVDDARGTLVALKITHQELANLIGSTRETVSLTLSQFKRKRLIQTEGRKVIISDTEALRALCSPRARRNRATPAPASRGARPSQSRARARAASRRARDAGARDVVGGAVIRRRAHDRQAERDVHRLVEVDELDRDQALVVIHRDERVVAAVRRASRNAASGTSGP